MISTSPAWLLGLQQQGAKFGIGDIILHLFPYLWEFSVPSIMTAIFFFTCSLHVAEIDRLLQRVKSEKSLAAEDIIEEHIQIAEDLKVKRSK